MYGLQSGLAVCTYRVYVHKYTCMRIYIHMQIRVSCKAYGL